MKITIEAAGQRLVLTDDQFENFSLSIPRDTHVDAEGRRTLSARTHVALVGEFKEDVRPLWEEISNE